MDQIELQVQVRNEIGTSKVKKLRRAEVIPAIVYGGERKPTSIKVDRRTYEKIERQHQGESIVFKINVFEGDKKLRDYAAIAKDVQLNPVTDQILHIDFNRISLTEEIEVKVPIAPKGEAVGVKKDGGSLDQIIWELDIVCLPTNIPPNIEIDVSHLEIGNNIFVKDLTLPEGVVSKHDPEAIVCSVVPPMKEEPAEAPAEEGELTEPELIKEKKEGEEEEVEAEEKKPGKDSAEKKESKKEPKEEK